MGKLNYSYDPSSTSTVFSDRKSSQIRGSLDATDLVFGIAVSRFNFTYTERLLQSAVHALAEHGAKEENITIVWVPGAFEIPRVIKQLALTHSYAALIGLGLVIQGETSHAELIGLQITRLFADLGQACEVPIIDGVVTVYNEEQAVQRCQAGEEGRGWYAAHAAIEMVHVLRQLKARA